MTILCSTDVISEDQSKGFKIGDERLVLVKKAGQLYLYKNICPHLGVNLEYMEDEFLDVDKAYIICSNHSALFRIDSGLCISGPCQGQSLEAVNFSIEGDNVVVDL